MDEHWLRCLGLKACPNRHSGRAGVIPAFARKREPESRRFNRSGFPLSRE